MKTKNFLTAILLAMLSVFLLAGCTSPFKPPEDLREISVLYHLNGGEITGIDELDADGNYLSLHKGSNVTGGVPMLTPKKETWFFGGWYLEENFATKYQPSDERIPEAQADKPTLNLYAKWEDKIVLAAETFESYFDFSATWNGGLNDINAAVNWSLEPKKVYGYNSIGQYLFDPARSESVVLNIHGNEEVNSLILDSDTYFEAKGRVSGFKAGQTVGQAIASVFYEFPVDAVYNLYLLHKDPFTVTLNLSGGTIIGETTLSVLGGDVLDYEDLPSPTKVGFRFVGWEGTGHIDKKPVAKSFTLVAQFVEELTLSYDYNGEQLAPSVTLLNGDNLVLPKIEKANHEFLGWFYDAEFENKVTYTGSSESEDAIIPDIFIDKDTVLYARYEPFRVVSFDTNDGSQKPSIQVTNTKVPNLGTIPYKDGKYFGGWYLDSDCTEKYVEQPISEDLTLYALWYEGIYLGSDNFNTYFDVVALIEREPNTTPGYTDKEQLKITLTISIKDEFSDCLYSVYDTNVSVSLHKEHDDDCSNHNSDSVFLGNFAPPTVNFGNCTSSTAYQGQYVYTSTYVNDSFVYVYLQKSYFEYWNAIENTDHVYITYLDTGTIFFREGMLD